MRLIHARRGFKMRLYLSSYRLGDHVDQLMRLAGSGRNLTLIENAIDHVPTSDREAYRNNIYDIRGNLIELGFSVTNLDLRQYFGKRDDLEEFLKSQDVVMCTGGNVFLLRRAMEQSGFDSILKDSLEKDAFVYAGWSAGICVLAPSLRGLELCDPTSDLADGYNFAIIWEGLGVLDSTLIPHCYSDHPEATLVEKIVQYCKARNIDYRAMCDGDVMILEGDEMSLLDLESGQPSRLNLDKKTIQRMINQTP
jgi:dipeptidase E